MNPLPSDILTIDPPVPFEKVGTIYSGACRCGRPFSIYRHTSVEVPMVCACRRRWYVSEGKVVERLLLMPALCLDLDGTVRGSKSGSLYGCTDPGDVELLPNVETVLARFVKAGYFLVGITNQGGVVVYLRHPAFATRLSLCLAALRLPSGERVRLPVPRHEVKILHAVPKRVLRHAEGFGHRSDVALRVGQSPDEVHDVRRRRCLVGSEGEANHGHAPRSLSVAVDGPDDMKPAGTRAEPAASSPSRSRASGLPASGSGTVFAAISNRRCMGPVMRRTRSPSRITTYARPASLLRLVRWPKAARAVLYCFPIAIVPSSATVTTVNPSSTRSATYSANVLVQSRPVAFMVATSDRYSMPRAADCQANEDGKLGHFCSKYTTTQGGVGKGIRNEIQTDAIQTATRAAFKEDPFHLMLASYSYEGGNTPGWNVRSLHRKPSYGMLALAETRARDWGVVIDWGRSQFIGDMDSDQEYAAAAGIRFHWAKDFFGRQDVPWCDHDNTPSLPDVTNGDGQCATCGMVFLYCHGCSEAGGADQAIYHAPPECS